MAGDAERCSHCGRTLSGEEPAAADAYYWSFVCTGCAPSRTKACFFSPKERAVLKRFRQRLDERDLKLPRASVRRIQHHLNAVFSESFPLKSLPQLMKLIDAP
jgi:hypothetical protein